MCAYENFLGPVPEWFMSMCSCNACGGAPCLVYFCGTLNLLLSVSRREYVA